MVGVTDAEGRFAVTVPAWFELRAERSGFWTSVERVNQRSPWVRADGGELELRLEPPPPWATGPSLTELYRRR